MVRRLAKCLLALSVLGQAPESNAFHNQPGPAPHPDEAAVRARAKADASLSLSFVNVAVANLRAGASTESKILCQVGINAAVLERHRTGDWVSIEIAPHGAKGWLHASLLRPDAPGHARGHEQVVVPRSAPTASESKQPHTGERAQSSRPKPRPARAPTAAEPAPQLAVARSSRPRTSATSSELTVHASAIPVRVVARGDAVTITMATPGAELSVIDRENRWLLVRVTDSGDIGWIPEESLSAGLDVVLGTVVRVPGAER